MKTAITFKVYTLVAAISSTGATFTVIHDQSVVQMGSCLIYKASNWFSGSGANEITANSMVNNSTLAKTLHQDFGALNPDHAKKRVSQGLSRNACDEIP